MADPAKTRSIDPRPGTAQAETETGRSFDPRDTEIARLKRERDEWRARERVVRREAEQAQERLTQLARASRRFAASMRSGTGERQRYRRRIAAQYAVSRILAGARNLEEAAWEIMQILGERLGWEMGVLWTLSGEELRCEGIWRSPVFSPGSFEEACRQTGFSRGVGLPGRAWSSGEPVCAEDIREEDDPLRESAAEAGLRGALTFPVRDGGLVGVFELLRAEELVVDEDLLQTAALVGRQIGQFAERRRAETERDRFLFREREARRELSGILESISDAFFAVDREWRFTYVNRRAEELWSRSRKDLVGKNLWEEFPRAAGSEQYEMIRRAMEERTTTSFEAISPIVGVWVAGRAYPLANGGVAVYFDDVTERKRAEEALRESEERLQRAIAIESVGVLFFRAEGQITEANEAFLRMSGYDREDLAKGLLRWDVMTPPEWMPRSLEAIEELQTTGRSTPYEKEYIRKDGSRWWGLFAATRLREVDDEEVAVEFVIDVTGRKKAEEERERLVAHELEARAQADERRRISRELHDRVAHDIALVHQSLELYEALKEYAPEKAAAKLEVAKETVKRAFNATRNLSMELRQREVQRSLESALSDLLRDLVPPAVAFDLSVDGDEALVSAEARSQVFLILREAIRNAVIHSGCRRITVRSEILSQEITGCVEDDGRGFDARTLHLDARNGLRSMEERAALLGGTLEVSSVPGRGTTVRVTIPLAERDGG